MFISLPKRFKQLSCFQHWY